MGIFAVPSTDRKDWNGFIKNNYPPVGAFMQTWEWGEFQERLGRKVERYFVAENPKGGRLAAFTVIEYPLPLGLKYGYAARGPVLEKGAAKDAKKVGAIFSLIKDWVRREKPGLVFLRLEPPIELLDESLESYLAANDFVFPNYYVQPRLNHVIPLSSDEEMIGRFHPSTRSNINRAVKRGATVSMKTDLNQQEYLEFSKMMEETIGRNDGKNVYPDANYFRAFLEAMPRLGQDGDSGKLSLGIFYGYQNGEPAAANIVLFFGETATYLYGAANTKSLNSKITTYLHWEAMRESARRGYKYYDIGGVDPDLWPSLTVFKRQFRGDEMSYIGNVDVPIKKMAYLAYNGLKEWRKRLKS